MLERSLEDDDEGKDDLDAKEPEDATLVGVVPGDVARELDRESASSLTCWSPSESFDGWFWTEEVEEDRARDPGLAREREVVGLKWATTLAVEVMTVI